MRSKEGTLNDNTCVGRVGWKTQENPSELNLRGLGKVVLVGF